MNEMNELFQTSRLTRLACGLVISALIAAIFFSDKQFHPAILIVQPVTLVVLDVIVFGWSSEL